MLLCPINMSGHWSLAAVLRPDLLLAHILESRRQGVEAGEGAEANQNSNDVESPNPNPNPKPNPNHNPIPGAFKARDSKTGLLSSWMNDDEASPNPNPNPNPNPRCVFLHLDSMNMHPSDAIHARVTAYLMWEFLERCCGGDTSHANFRALKVCRMSCRPRPCYILAWR